MGAPNVEPAPAGAPSRDGFGTTPPFAPYPPIEAHGVVGDRRTAALVAADGTVDWLCLPDYDGSIVFGVLLDADRGGFWRLGPRVPVLGRQRYLDESAALVTTWAIDGAELELTDAMAWPQAERRADDVNRRALVRRLRCTSGRVACRLEIRARTDFEVADAAPEPFRGGLLLRAGDRTLGLWASVALEIGADGAGTTIELSAGEEVWAVVESEPAPEVWTVLRAEAALAEAVDQTAEWSTHLDYCGPRAERVRRSAMIAHLLHHAPTGSLVAAPTTSLPERIGGDRNYDYRFAWARDASLSISILCLLGDAVCAEGYLTWLAELGSSTDSPFQVVYGIDGRTDLTQTERTDLAGYRGSRPIRFGNHAFNQRQLDSLGYLADCVLTYLERGENWDERYWEMVRRAAEYTAAHWQEADSGIWELTEEAQYVSSKVMSWVTLDRAARIAERLDRAAEADRWRPTMREIHTDVMARGWSERQGAFVQRYGAEVLDASALLIPVMGFLPADHPRVVATVDRVAEQLAVDGLVHRFLNDGSADHDESEAGEFEGAFLPCTFWLATAYAMGGRRDQADGILGRVEDAAGELGLLPEELDARDGTFLGNLPLLFSHAEYIRAVLALSGTDSTTTGGAR